jgi:serine/threonine-protein kinase
VILGGKYEIVDLLGTGGMASVHVGRVVGPAGFSRLVAIKQIHEHLASDPSFIDMFLDEGRLAAHIHHPNVVATIDVIAESSKVLLVLDYVHGVSLSELLRAGPVAPRLASAILVDVLTGLHAAHEAKGEDMRPLRIVHRDVSPQNVLVGEDGVARVLDFGIARATVRAYETKGGAVRGKIRYMAPEQLNGEVVDRRVDVFAAGVVLWEMLTGRRLHDGDDAAVIVSRLRDPNRPPPSAFNPDVSPALDAVVSTALADDRDRRFETASAMVEALEAAAPPARAREVGAWVRGIASETLDARARRSAEPMTPSARPTPTRARVAPPDEPTAPLADDEASATPGACAPSTSGRAPTVGPPARQPRLRAIASLGLVVVFLGGGAVFLATRRHDSPATAAPPTASVALAAPASSPPPPSSVAPTASEPAPPSAAPLSSRRPGAGSPKGAGVTTKRPRTPRSDCVPPYVVEADGTKRFRPECM